MCFLKKKITRTGAWMSVIPFTINGTELGSQECRYSLFLRYDIDLPKLPDHCDGCGAEFDTCHALDCKQKASSRRIKIRSVVGSPELQARLFPPHT